jgi:hypothetical protein
MPWERKYKTESVFYEWQDTNPWAACFCCLLIILACAVLAN